MDSTLMPARGLKNLINDPRMEVFLSAESRRVFRSIATPVGFYRRDPFDVPSIHAEARLAFERVLQRSVQESSGLGRMLLFKGEAGAGKTHLLHSLRTNVHERGAGYCVYVQMTTASEDYDSYLLKHLVDGLQQAYTPHGDGESCLSRLTGALFDVVVKSVLEGKRVKDKTEREKVIDLISKQPHQLTRCADRLKSQPRFQQCDVDLLRVCLHLLRNDPLVTVRACKWLRCETLSPEDLQMIGGVAGHGSAEDPAAMLQKMTCLIAATHHVPLVLMVDQLEDIADQPQSESRFRGLINSLVRFTEAEPTAVVTLASLDNFFEQYQAHLPQPKLHRLIRDPQPVQLLTGRSAAEIESLTAARLRSLYEDADVRWDSQDPLYPFHPSDLQCLTGLSTRDVLYTLQEHAVRCSQTGVWSEPARFVQQDQSRPVTIGSDGLSIDKATCDKTFTSDWNHFQSSFIANLPDSAAEQATILRSALEELIHEFPGWKWERCTQSNHLLNLVIQQADGQENEFAIGVCSTGKWSQEYLAQLDAVGRSTPSAYRVVVRSTEFARSGKIARKLAEIISDNGRAVVACESQWRTMMAFLNFAILRRDQPRFRQWQQTARPLSDLDAMQQILNLKSLGGGEVAAATPKSEVLPPILASFANDRMADTDSALRRELGLSNVQPRTADRSEQAAQNLFDTIDHAEQKLEQLLSDVEPVADTPAAASPDTASQDWFASADLALNAAADLNATEEQPDGPAAACQPAADRSLLVGQSLGFNKRPVTFQPRELTQHAAFLGGSGSGKTTAALNLIEQLLLQGTPVVMLDRKGDLCHYADEGAWTRPLDAERSAMRSALAAKLDVAVFTPGNAAGRPLALPLLPDGFLAAESDERAAMARQGAAALAAMLGLKSSPNNLSQIAILSTAIETLARVQNGPITLDGLQQFIEERAPDLLQAIPGTYPDSLYKQLATALLTLNLNHRHLFETGESLTIERLLGLQRNQMSGRVQLSVICTKFLDSQPTIDFWVAQLLISIRRWCSQSPSDQLQAVFLFDEADAYLPAGNRQPATKQPMEELLKRSRSAGVSIFLGTQSPGDLDYRCKENIRNWMVGNVKQSTALEKLKAVFTGRHADAIKRLAAQKPGEFHLAREADVDSVYSQESLVQTRQLSEDQIAELAKRGRLANR